MHAYTSVTTSPNIIRELGRFQWRWMATPFISHSAYTAMLKTGWRYALDNGAWDFRYANENKVKKVTHEMGVTLDFSSKGNTKYDEERFMWMVDRYGLNADFVVMPDVIGSKEHTILKAEHYLPRLKGLKVMITVQDRMLEKDIVQFLEKGVGIFIGGSTRWKMKKMPYWSEVAKRWGVLCHCGRINTEKRIEKCREHGVDSFDGSAFARWYKRAKQITDYMITTNGGNPHIPKE